MANILIEPLHQFTDELGSPVSLGKVYTYENNTETDKATYTDDTETTANANPIILDAGGRAPIWILTDGDYTFKVTTADDDLVDTINDISGNVATFNSVLTQANNIDMNSNAIVTSTNNQNIFITPNGTGTVNITNIELQTAMDTNGFDILLDSGNCFKETSGTKKVLDLNAVSSSVNNLKVTNASTGNDPIISAVGTDTDVGISLVIKGASDANGSVSGYGLTGRGGAITTSGYTPADDDDLATMGYVTSVVGTMDYSLDEHETSLFLPTFATDTQAQAGTDNTVLLSPSNISHMHPIALLHGTVTYSTGTPTLNDIGLGVGPSITDLGVGVWRINGVVSVANGGLAGWNGDCAFAGSGYPDSSPNATDTIVNITGIVGGASGTISGSCTDGSATTLADHPFHFSIFGGKRV